MVKSPTQVSTLMRLSAMVLPSKVESSADKKQQVVISLALILFPSVLKLSVELWARSSQKDLTFQLKNLKFSQPIKTTNRQSPFKSSKEKDPWLKTTIYWEDSTWLESQLLLEEHPKLKSHSKLIKTLSCQYKPSKKDQERRTTSSSRTNKENFLKSKSKECSEKPKSSLRRTN